MYLNIKLIMIFIKNFFHSTLKILKNQVLHILKGFKVQMDLKLPCLPKIQYQT